MKHPKHAPHEHEPKTPDLTHTSYEEAVKSAGDIYTKYVHRIADKERATDIKYDVETEERKKFELSDEQPLEHRERKL